MEKIHVIGIGLNKKDLTARHLDLIRNATLLAGGARQLDRFPEFQGKRLIVTADIDGFIQTLKQEMAQERIVVLASGDPLFYGIGSTLLKHIPASQLAVHPNITSIASAFSAIYTPWHDAEIVNFHSRPYDDFDFKGDEHKVAFLTSPARGPEYIANQLIGIDQTPFKICVLERLGNPDTEKVSWFDTPKELLKQRFSCPNIVILLKPVSNGNSVTRTDVSHETHLGMPDDRFNHENGLITKAEVRAVTLSKLRLTNKNHILWDIGSGSASVSIEAAALIPEGKIFAVEKNKQRCADIKENIKKFSTHQIRLIEADFPQTHEAMDRPDRVFIGGGGKGIENIIDHCCARLTPSGVIVINTVIIENMNSALKALEAHNFSPEFIQIQINRSHSMQGGRRMDALNPVWIISGKKPS